MVAGADLGLAAAAALAMTLLQLGIGTLNDVVDAPFDAGRKPGKPIPAGLVARPLAGGLAGGLLATGTAIAAARSTALGGLAVVVVAIGVVYDLRLKGTVWSWLPFAVGIPILPVFGWLAARSTLEPFFAILVPAAMVAGAALAIANAFVDVERDRAAGRTSAASALGGQAGLVAGGLFAIVWIVAVASTTPGTLILPTVILAGSAATFAALAARRSDPARRELAWRVEAIATGALGVVWLIGALGQAAT